MKTQAIYGNGKVWEAEANFPPSFIEQALSTLPEDCLFYRILNANGRVSREWVRGPAGWVEAQTKHPADLGPAGEEEVETLAERKGQQAARRLFVSQGSPRWLRMDESMLAALLGAAMECGAQLSRGVAA